MKYNKNMTIAEILFSNPKALQIFKKYKIDCQTCLGSETATIEVVSRINDIKLSNILRDLEELDEI